MKSYLKNSGTNYKNLKEWIGVYKPFLKHAFSETDVNWDADPYQDPDSKMTNSEEFYKTLKTFLKAQEKSFQEKKLLTGNFVYTFDILSHPYIKVEEVDKDGNHQPLFYLKSDQFGFSAPSQEKNHPYDSYIEKSENKNNAITNVAKWIYESRTIGGSFLWPLEVNSDEKPIDNPPYNIARGGSCKRGTYIEDRVDLTLLEIKTVLEGAKEKCILANYINKNKNLERWLNHFKVEKSSESPFTTYVDFFCFNAFVIEDKQEGRKEYKIRNIITSDFYKTIKGVYGKKDIYNKKKPLEIDKMEKMLNTVNCLIKERTEDMENILKTEGLQ